MSAGWAKGSTRAWREVRARVLRLDLPAAQRPRCAIGLAGCTTKATHAHHLHGKASGCPGCKADHIDHIAPACAWCNLSTGSPAAADPAPRPNTQW